MRAGKLNRKVQFYSRQKVKGAQGGTTEKLMPMGAPIWAGIKHVSSSVRDETKEGGEVTVIQTEITIRYRPGIAEQMIVVYGDAKYRIEFVNNWEERNRLLILKCVDVEVML